MNNEKNVRRVQKSKKKKKEEERKKKKENGRGETREGRRVGGRANGGQRNKKRIKEN